MENNIFNETKISKAYIKLSLPLVFSMVVTLVYNLADTFFVAQTNNTDIVTGVSLGAPVFTLLMAFGNIFGQGGSSLISRYLGEKKNERASRVSSFSFYITILLGIVIAVLMMLMRTPVVRLLGADEASFPHAMDYYTYLVIGAPILMLSFIHSNLLRAEGLSKESMAGTIFGALVNIVLDPLFISTFGMGAGGAAIATIIGYFCADVFYGVMVVKKSHVLSMDPRLMKIPGGDVKELLLIGIPSSIVNVMQSVSVVLMNQFLLPYGNEKIAAMGIVLKVSMIALLLLTGFSFGGQPLYGYYYGARDRRKLKNLLSFSLKFIIAIALILTAFVCLAAPLLMRAFMKDPQIVSDGTYMLRWQVITMVFVGVIMLFTIIFQSFGKALGSFILSISRQGIVFLVVLLIAKEADGYNGIVVSQAIADLITAIIAAVLFVLQLKKEFTVPEA
jgi:multidrug efflux pump